MTGRLVSCGVWNDRTVAILSERTGLTTDKLWEIIEAQSDIERLVKSDLL